MHLCARPRLVLFLIRTCSVCVVSYSRPKPILSTVLHYSFTRHERRAGQFSATKLYSFLHSPLWELQADGLHCLYEQGTPAYRRQGRLSLQVHQEPRVPAAGSQNGLQRGPDQSRGQRHKDIPSRPRRVSPRKQAKDAGSAAQSPAAGGRGSREGEGEEGREEEIGDEAGYDQRGPHIHHHSLFHQLCVTVW